MSKKPNKSNGNGHAAEAEAQPSTIIDLAAATLTGDVRDGILDLLRRIDKPWTKLSQLEQSRLIGEASRIATGMVRGAVDIIAHREFPHIVVTAGKWTVKDGAVAIQLGAVATEEAVRHLIRHAGSGVLVLADASVFNGERAPAQPMPDQPDLPMGEGASAGMPLDDAAKAFEANAGKAPTPDEVDAAAGKRARKRAARKEEPEDEAEPIGDVAERVVAGAGHAGNSIDTLVA